MSMKVCCANKDWFCNRDEMHGIMQALVVGLGSIGFFTLRKYDIIFYIIPEKRICFARVILFL